MERKFTRHLIICINSFNASTYVQYALELTKNINMELNYGGIKFSILCVFGGCNKYNVCTIKNTTYLTIPQNLSDHNIYMGINYCNNLPTKFFPEKATCVMLHDTCTVKQGCFRKMMMKLSRYDIKGWVFAHALGLYNIGVCDLDFAINHSKKWVGINFLDKETSIKLEHSVDTIQIQNHVVPGLRKYSNKTLNSCSSNVKDFNELDYHSIIPLHAGTKPRHVVFLGALGIFKFTHSPGPFLLPIWVNNYAPSSEDEYNELSSNVHVDQHKWVRALIPYSGNKIEIED